LNPANEGKSKMKVTVPSQALNDGLRRVLNIVNVRSTLPVLGNVLIAAHAGRLELSTTDLEVSITTSMEAETETEGETTLPAKKFGQIVGTLGNGEVHIETDDSLTSTISCGNAMFHIIGLDPSEFPKELEFVEDKKLELSCIEFAKTLRKIAYAVSNDQTRYVLNGIMLAIHEGNFTAVATDGRRLALVEKIMDSVDESLKRKVILPIKVVNELQKLLDEDGTVELRLAESRASFSISDTVLTTKLVEGEYPNYRQVIPSSFKNSVVLPRETFANVLNRVAVVVTDSGASVRFQLTENALELSANSSDLGDATEPMNVAYDGEPVTIAFNPGFLRDPLRTLDADDMTIRFNDEFKPVAILGDEGFLYVIMPMRN
jgi:DNA polymerase-3 subunit beta